MTKQEITEIYLRNLKRLRAEIETYPSDDALWGTKGSVTNSGGNLALHLIGNVNHFIGATLAQTGYLRDREAEFNTKGLSREKLIAMIDEAADQVASSLGKINDEQMQQEYPFDFAGKHNTAHYLIFFIGHFEYHLGQINYHRRMV